VLLVELIRHRYKVDSPAAKANFLAALRDKVRRDPGKRAALDYLDEFEGRFWAEADERVREITDRFEKRIDAEAKAGMGISGIGEANLGGATADTRSTEVRTELAGRFQRIVNETQLARLNKMLVVLDEDILESPQNYTYVVVDDLDRDWVDEKLANSLIRCLFRTVVDLQRVRNLKIIVALRTNIFVHLDFGKRSGGQEEKFRALTLKMRWANAELRDMVNERVRVALDRVGIPVTTIHDLLPAANKRHGDPMDYMLNRTLMRPRDIIAFLNECFVAAGGKSRLAWEDIQDAERSYSTQRLLALRDEWKTSYPNIDMVFNIFAGCELPLSKEALTDRLNEVALLAAHPEFRGGAWLSDMTDAMWHSEGHEIWSDWYQPLVVLLYEIGFLGIGAGKRSKVLYSLDSPDYASRASNLDNAIRFDIHPTFQAELDTRRKYDSSKS
jgi:hypothetical protein